MIVRAPSSLRVGVLTWAAPEPRATIVVRARCDWSFGGDLALRPDGEPPRLEGVSDYVPYKPRVDVLIQGRAFGAGDVWTECQIRAPGINRRLHALAGRELTPENVRTLGRAPAHLAGRVDFDPRATLALDAREFDFSYFQAAEPEQTTRMLRPRDTIVLRGLSVHAEELIARMPDLAPRVRVGYGESEALPLTLDTVELDTEGLSVALVWRAVLAGLPPLEITIEDGRTPEDLFDETVAFSPERFESVPPPRPQHVEPRRRGSEDAFAARLLDFAQELDDLDIETYVEDEPVEELDEGVPLAPRFELLEVLGRGGAGVVNRARDTETGRDVAVKRLELGPEHRARFLREIRVLRQGIHPRIVRYVAHGETPEGGLYVATELLRGRSLATHLAGARLEPAQVVGLLRLVAEALVAAHDRGVIHRDLKPENIYLRGGHLDDVVLLDFGLASIVGEKLTGSRTFLGTPGYAAPEQLRSARVGPEADIFALGVIAYECLAGKAPFGVDSVDVLRATLFTKPADVRTFAPMVPEELADLIMRALDKEPTARPHDARALLEETALDVLGPAQAEEDKPRWALGAVVRKSALATLFEARDRTTGDYGLVQRFSREGRSRRNELAAIAHEREVLRGSSSPSLIIPTEVSSTADELLVAVPTPRLGWLSLVRPSDLPLEVILVVLVDVDQALAVAHEVTVTHGLVSTPWIAISRFGAHLVGPGFDRTLLPEEVAVYEAPEQRELGVRAPSIDLFALGSLANDLLARRSAVPPGLVEAIQGYRAANPRRRPRAGSLAAEVSSASQRAGRAWLSAREDLAG